MGAQLQNRNFSAKGEEAFVPSSLSQSAGLFMLEKRDWRQWQFEVGGRFEHTAHNPQATSLQTRNFNLYSVSAGSAWRFMEGYQIDLTATRGQRRARHNCTVPTAFMWRPILSEQGIKPWERETSNNLILHYKKRRGTVTGKVNLFYNHINDYIFQQKPHSNGDHFAGQGQ